MSKARFINAGHISGLLYEHDLQMKETGPSSKNPGTPFITGTISIATDDAMTNIIPIHYTYITQITSSGKTDSRWDTLSQIINEKIKTVMGYGAENAAKVRIDSSIALNEFYTDRDGKEELVSAKRYEGGFIHLETTLEEEKKRNIFDIDMVITGTRTIEADPERDLPEKLVLKGAIFDFRKALLPVEFSVTDTRAISYFEGLESSAKNPVFTRLKGKQVSETIKREIIEESAFGDPSVREVTSNRKDWIINWAQPEPYVWDDDSSITAADMKEAMANREVYLSTIKARQDEYKARRAQNTAAATKVSNDTTFNF